MSPLPVVDEGSGHADKDTRRRAEQSTGVVIGKGQFRSVVTAGADTGDFAQFFIQYGKQRSQRVRAVIAGGKVGLRSGFPPRGLLPEIPAVVEILRFKDTGFSQQSLPVEILQGVDEAPPHCGGACHEFGITCLKGFPEIFAFLQRGDGGNI